MTSRFPFALIPPLAFVLFTGCDRMKMDSNSLSFKAPDQAALGLPNIGADKKFCFGVNIMADDLITREATACAPKWGQGSDALVDSGQDIVVSSAAGKNREIELYAYLTDASAACPSGGEAWAAKAASLGRLYKAGSVSGVEISGPDKLVTMPVSGIKLNQSVMSSQNLSACERPEGAALVSQLTAAGEVLSANDDPRGDSLLTVLWESLIQWNPFGGDVGGSSAAGDVFDAKATAAFPAYLRSVTKKPDSLDYFALMGEGEIVRVTPAGDVVTLDADTCPFAFTGCKVPAWIQSISPGYGSQLYVHDHAGQIYRQNADESLTQVATVPPTVAHAVYY